MTREQVINYLRSSGMSEEQINGVVEGLTCEDAVSRQAMLDGLASIAKVKAKSDAQKALMGRVMFFTEQLPPVTPKQRTGKWIYEKRERLVNETDEGAVYVTDYWCKCSKCGGDFGYRKMKDAFCKYCGAKMEGVVSE